MRPTWLTPICWIAALAFAGVAVRASWIDLRDNHPADAVADSRKDVALRAEARFGRLRPVLPPFGVVGYLAGKTGNPEADNQYYVLVQYALAPLIVHRSIDAMYVAANFPDSATLQQALRENPTLRLVWEDPRIRGVAVLQNTSPPDANAAPATQPAPPASPERRP
ncbi:MAG: hypothetical protein NTW19_06375 [Planctomycetota bacterium]|nr:hypothetical protein [Planctomycetota bacterium]